MAAPQMPQRQMQNPAMQQLMRRRYMMNMARRQQPQQPQVPTDALSTPGMGAQLADDMGEGGDPAGVGTGGGGTGGDPTYTPPPSGGMPMYRQGMSPGGNPFNSRDVFDQFQRIGQNSYQQGQDADQEFGGLSNYYRGRQGQYGDRVESLYNPIWEGGGGYRPDQMENVLQQGGLDDIQSQLGDNQLYDWERNQIRGDPYKAFELFRGQAPALTDLAARTGDAATGHAAQGRNRSDSALDRMRFDYESAIDPRKLSLSEGYKPGIDSALQRGRAGVTAAQTDPGLDVTQEYERQAGMSDAEVSDMASRAAQDVGARYGADRDAIWQQAAASGQGSPAQMASVMNRLNRSSAADRGDAITRARLQARAAQRDAAGNVQNTKLNAGQYRAGLRSGNELALQNSDIAANTTAEQMRLAAEQGISGARLGAAGNLGNAALNSNNAMTQAQINAALQGGQMQLGTGMYNANMATGLVGQGEQQDQQRSQGLATNRQNTNQHNQGMGLGINQARSNRYQQAYAPWLANQQEGRQAATGQQGFYANQGNTSDAQRLANKTLAQQGQQQAAGGYGNWGSTGGQGFGDVLGKSFAGAFGKLLGSGGSGYQLPGKARGGMIDQNQLIEVGEGDRPEAILPLMPATPVNRRNMWERMGADLGKSLGLPEGNAYHANLKRQEMLEPEEPEGYAKGGIPNMALGGEYDWRSMLPDNVRGFLPEEPDQDDQSDPWSNEYGYEGYARGGIPNAKSILNKSRYRMNMGRHNNGNRLGYGEMGNLGRA